MRRILLTTLMLAGFGGLVLPILYFVYSRDLPDLDSRESIRRAVANSVEGERRGTTVVGQRYDNVRFEVWPVSKLPKALVGGVLAVDGCPEYLGAAKDAGFPRTKRLLRRWAFGDKRGAPGPGRCQLVYADLLSSSLGAVDPMHAAIADHKILNVMDPEDLLAYRIATAFYAPGLVGMSDAAKKLFKKDLDALSVAQIGELLAAENGFPDWLHCKNPGKLKLIRDATLDRMEAFRGITAAEAKAARTKPVSCSLAP